ncbi:XamI family restriction endonuclease [Salipiger sp. P9]|uniref:XamI family restriction endonuclease n=1 Tax=Salipiger pentaromativorans TaxID=2943193 RepID=UPI0021582C9A|nr:XamI family restriction endonuclease [Salipiger pentaromativorans]MCR8548663.1 XamI family restriction endonuclease [Salipiger pentaromativorans]
MIDPPVWSDADLETHRLRAISAFSTERLEEPLEDYLEAFDEYRGHVEEILDVTGDLTRLEETALAVLGEPRLLEAFRYLAGPPVSEDDLKVLADARSLARGTLEKTPALVQRLIGVVRQVLDRRRFAWAIEGRAPTTAERDAAVLASAALMAASRTQTLRRTHGKDRQEAMVKDALTALGFTEVPSRKILTISQAPAQGEFCGESVLGNRKGDIIVRLRDDRVMPIECKVSNSSTNSVKRLNNDAAVKAVSWKRDFGLRQVVPCAVLSGVYKLHNLLDAQERGLAIFWAHDLDPLTEWIARTRP